jgi:PST family polysaccharide transporter
MKWAVLQQLFAQGSNYLVFFVLSMLVPPSELGLIALASASLALLSAFTDTGLGAAVIQRPQLEPGHLSSTFVVNVAAGAVLTLVGVGLAFGAARLYDAPRLAPLMTVLAAGFLIRSLGLTHATVAQRELRFRSLALRDLVAGIASVPVGVGMALAGFGIWSLVGSALVGAVVGVITIWTVTPWRPRVSEVSRRHIAELWSFGSHVFGFNLGKAIVQNVDRLLIGHLLGTSAVGIYALASKLVLAPVSGFVGAIGGYLFPAYARVQHDLRAVRADYLRTTRTIMRIVLAYLVLVVFLAPAVVRVFGPEWSAAVPVARWLTVAAFFLAVFVPMGQLLKALNRPGWLLAWSVGFSAAMLLGIAVGARWGVTGAAIGFAAAYAAMMPVAAVMAWRLRAFDVAETLASWRGSLLGAAGLALLLWALGTSHVLGSPLGVILGVTVAVGLYAGLILWSDRRDGPHGASS